MKAHKNKKKKKAPAKKAQATKPEQRARQKQEDALDKALMDSFPASDPVSMTEPAATPTYSQLEDEERRRREQQDVEHAPGP